MRSGGVAQLMKYAFDRSRDLYTYRVELVRAPRALDRQFEYAARVRSRSQQNSHGNADYFWHYVGWGGWVVVVL